MKTVVISPDVSANNYVERVAGAVVSAAGQEAPSCRVLVFLDRGYPVNQPGASILGLTVTRRTYEHEGIKDPLILRTLRSYDPEYWTAAVFFTPMGLPDDESNKVYFTHNLAHELEHARFFSIYPAAYHLGSFLRDSYRDLNRGKTTPMLDWPDEQECERVGKAATISMFGATAYEDTIKALFKKSQGNPSALPSLQSLLQMDPSVPPRDVERELIMYINDRPGLREKLLAHWEKLYKEDCWRSSALLAREVPEFLGSSKHPFRFLSTKMT